MNLPCRPLWALDDLLRDAVLGVCLPPETVRAAITAGGLPEGTVVPDDYTLHTAVVAHCSQANTLSCALQRLLEGRHAAIAERFAREAGDDAERLMALWRSAAAGGGCAAALWACATHPLCDDRLACTLRGDLQVLQFYDDAVGVPPGAPLSGYRGLAAQAARRGPPRSRGCTAG